jgi:hypothetical protein
MIAENHVTIYKLVIVENLIELLFVFEVLVKFCYLEIFRFRKLSLYKLIQIN